MLSGARAKVGSKTPSTGLHRAAGNKDLKQEIDHEISVSSSMSSDEEMDKVINENIVNMFV